MNLQARGTTPLDDVLTAEEIAEIRAAFFDQARSALEVLGHELLGLEGQAPNAARLRSPRRAAHTLKGDCASVGFPELSRLAHALEDSLGAIERAGRPVTPDQGDLLLAALDALRGGLEAGERGEPGPDPAPVIRRLTLLGVPRDDGAVAPEVAGRLREGRLRGLTPLRLLVDPGARGSRRRVAGVLRRLGVEPVAWEPRGGEEEGAAVVLALATAPLAEVASRAARLKTVRVQVGEWAGDEAAVEAEPRSEAGRDSETVRIEARRVDEVLNLVGEMVTVRATLAGLAAEIDPHVPEELVARLADAHAILGRVLQDLQRSAMRMRMVPVSRVFRRFTRVVRDLARRTGRRAALQIEGETTELDRSVLDALEEPLLHLVRNAVDHGLEPAEERLASGKAEHGRVVLRASREGNQVVIEVSDDGRGIDVPEVVRKAHESGLLRADEEPVHEDACQLVFAAGLSTAREVTENSGRGVGLDVVREKVGGLKGTIRAVSVPGKGTSFVIRVPLTVAIIQALLFRAGGRTLAVPLTAVVEIARAVDLGRQRVGPGEVVRVRDAVLALVDLGPLLGGPSQAGDYVLVLQSASGRFGLLVDELLGEQELVIKAVHDRFVKTPLVAGASQLPGGGLVLILDVLAVDRAGRARGGSSRG